MMRILLIGLAGALIMAAAADAQRQIQPRRPTPSGATQIDTQTVRSIEVSQCRPSDNLRMSRGGLSFTCEMNIEGEFQPVILAFDGGTQPGGISAAMTLLVDWREHKNVGQHILVWYRQPDQAHIDICNAVRTPSTGTLPCRELVSFSG